MIVHRGMGDSTGPQIGPYVSVPPPPTPGQVASALAQSQSDYTARHQRCRSFEQTEQGFILGAAGLILFAAPGAWKLLALLAIPATMMAGFGASPFPRSPDCDYGF